MPAECGGITAATKRNARGTGDVPGPPGLWPAEFLSRVSITTVPSRVADMKQTGRKLAHRALGAQLRHDEAVEEPA